MRLAVVTTISALTLALSIVTCGPGKPKEAAPARDATTASAPVVEQGKVLGEIRVAPSPLEQNQTYTASYYLNNGTQSRITVLRLETNRGALTPGTPGWQSSIVEPGRSTVVAQVTAKATAIGAEIFRTTCVTDVGSYDAVLSVPVSAPAQAVMPGRVIAEVLVNPAQVAPSEPVTITYDLTDSLDSELTVLSIDIDSSAPLTPESRDWLTDRVPRGSARTIVRRTVVKTEPGTYTIRAKFNTNQGIYTAPSKELKVIAAVQADTGHVTARIVITPNPCPINSGYVIEYQIDNTTRKDVGVTSVNTDIGTYSSSSPEWLSGNARAGQTTTVARLNGRGDAATSRSKRARFDTSEGGIDAPPVLLIVQ